MNENMNEVTLTTVDQTTANIPRERVIEETKNYVIVVTANGEVQRKMKYEKFWSVIPETDEEMEKLFIVMNDTTNEFVKAMKLCDGQEITIKNVLFNPYSKFNEETLGIDYGVTTMIETLNGDWYATSSKTSYYQLQNIFEAFGFPNEERYKTVKVQITLKQEQKGYSTNLKFKGIIK